MMPRLDGKISAIAEQILKRPLSDEEELEIFRISDAVGMKDVQSFLHLLLVFKLHEQTMKEKFGEIAELEKKIHETLESSIRKVLLDGTERIGAELGDSIVSRAEGVLASVREYASLRGQTLVVCFFWVISAFAYWIGVGNILRHIPSGGILETLLFLPAGWGVFFCGSFYSTLWACDHWKEIKKKAMFKAIFGAQVFFLLLLVLALL
jgi:hypothetical protein